MDADIPSCRRCMVSQEGPKTEEARYLNQAIHHHGLSLGIVITRMLFKGHASPILATIVCHEVNLFGKASLDTTL